jgi:predicted amidohydrolase
MSTVRIALANIRYPDSPEDSVARTNAAIRDAAVAGAAVVCFPEVYVPGYRAPGRPVPPPDDAFLAGAWAAIAQTAAEAHMVVILGTERLVDNTPRITTLVINADGTVAGLQDKVQLDPSEESIYVPGEGRRVFTAGALVFGVAICHEGFRYPETVRWAARHGAHVVFLPHFSWAESGSHRPATFAEAANSFHEKAILCRAAENTCFVAAVNYATDGAPTTSVVARPDGTVLAWQPYDTEGLLIVDIDTAEATGLLASRYRPS